MDALDLLVRAHKLAPENTDVIFLLARVSMTQNYFEDAIPLLESGLKIASEAGRSSRGAGRKLLHVRQDGERHRGVQTLIELDPSARSYAFMGLSYRHLGRFDEASKYFEEGLKHDPHNTSCLFNMGYIEERQGNHARAEELFQQALRSNPDFAEALLELANLRIKDKKFEEAVDVAAEICESKPQSCRRLLQAGHGRAEPASDGCRAERFECLPDALEEFGNRTVSLSTPF